jgi:DNA-binding NtrC family response regulator
MRILLVDDEVIGLRATADFLIELGHQVTDCDDPRLALDNYYRDSYPLVLSDVRMPQMSGLELLKEIKSSPGADQTDVVLFTGFGDAESASEAIRSGAFDFIVKPFDVAELADLIERIDQRHALTGSSALQSTGNAANRVASDDIQDEVRLLRKVLASYMVGDELVFHSAEMLTIVDQAKRYHRDPGIPVLITGETGTGKEVISRLIHFGEGGANAPYVDINCAAITPSLFESELFGYEGGAFTGGRVKGQRGKLDLAAGGTLFLDEVAELPLEMQGKLLRVLQEKYFYRVGGLEKIPFRARLICATNVHLEHAVACGLFRKDLYYRLSVGNINIPALRDRAEDILPLAEIFLLKFAREKKKSFRVISNSAIEELRKQNWPGNIRELKNLLEWAVFMFDDEALTREHVLSFFNRSGRQLESTVLAERVALTVDSLDLPQGGFDLNQHISSIVQAALDKFDNNKSKTAKYLGLSRRVLYGLIKKMN